MGIIYASEFDRFFEVSSESFHTDLDEAYFYLAAFDRAGISMCLTINPAIDIAGLIVWSYFSSGRNKEGSIHVPFNPRLQ
jgi:hypothetical protein